ncbi:hypothetical protein D9757_002704 [Collybiopsis confluens]|uniref:Uncharacterized protein n=1 Tax=Collybiopsis confluens TaxID=2823264 RepID=A0A8H5HW84_9AGAR|nr:hypothetical protein D9757_002704 [Collybiopsis confluens]
MELMPRYPQPFTLSEAALLDVLTISEEITRLQLSLRRLMDTQAMLKQVIQEAGSPEEADADIVQAFKENQGVIGSQEERILILKLALSDKGVGTAATHYDIESSKAIPDALVEAPSSNIDIGGSLEVDDSGGLHL